MPLEPGTSLGAYEILERIGEGGMGVVYRAKDGKLGRDVAVKLLPDAVAEDAERLARLQREARILASLNHPGIGAIYSLEEAAGTHFLVLELVPGETLAERLTRGPLPLREAIPLFAQIAEAMEAAHEHGILHRDLKPSNVKLTPDGKVKILDFGLAKEMAEAHPEDSLSSSPTLTRHTEAGIVLGTAPYLSPEQARGKPLDKRTDVWAFGCCLYEALTGKAAFLGETLSDTIANVLQREPDWNRLPRSTTPALARLLRRSLEKEPAERLRDLGDARLELKEASREPIAPAADEKRSWMPWALGLGALVVLLAAIVVPRFAPEPEEGFRLTNIRRVTSFPGDETEPALSPDGEFVVFVSRRSGNSDLWLKNLSGGDPIQLTNHPADDFDPAWSPDGTTIAFRSARNRGGLYTQPAFGGDATRISDFGFRPRWSPDGKQILFQTRRASFIPNELYLLDYPPRSEPRKLLSFERGKDPYLEADWAPDGNSVIYRSGTYVAGAGLGVLTPVPEGEERYLEWQGEKIAGQNAVFTADGRGVVLSAGSLWHLPLDEELRPTGPPVRLTTGQDNVPDLSKNGRRLAYNTSTSQTDIWKVPLDPETGLAAGPAVRVIDHPADDGAPSPLPDNRHFLFTSNREQDRWLYVADLDGGNVRVVSKSHFGRSYASPDGRWIATSGASAQNTPGPDGVIRNFTGTATLFLLPFDPVTQETAGPPIELEGIPNNWSPDGKQLLVSSATSDRPELQILDNPTSDDRRWVFSTFREDFARRYPRPTFAHFTPDGEWIVFGAYKERHRPAVFVVRKGSDDPRLLWEGSGFPWPSSDPERVYITSERGDETDGKLGFAPFDPVAGVATGDFQAIELPAIRGGLVIPESQRVAGANNCRMTPDRRWLLCEFEEVEGDVYVADVER